MLEREMPFHVVHPPESGLLPAKLVWNPTEGKYAADQRRWQGIPGIERTAGGKIYALFSGHKKSFPNPSAIRRIHLIFHLNL